MLAESRALAEDAAELIEVEYEPLESVANMADALTPSKPALWEKAKGNLLYDHTDTPDDSDKAYCTVAAS